MADEEEEGNKRADVGAHGSVVYGYRLSPPPCFCLFSVIYLPKMRQDTQ